MNPPLPPTPPPPYVGWPLPPLFHLLDVCAPPYPGTDFEDVQAVQGLYYVDPAGILVIDDPVRDAVVGLYHTDPAGIVVIE